MNSAIYGLSQASRVFYQTLRNFLVKELKFRVCKSDACVLMKEKIILGLYVDDVLIVGDVFEVERFIEMFRNKYKSRVYDFVKDFIGCELLWNENRTKVILHQSGMIKKLKVKVEKYMSKYNIRKKNIPMTKGHCVRQLKDD